MRSLDVSGIPFGAGLSQSPSVRAAAGIRSTGHVTQVSMKSGQVQAVGRWGYNRRSAVVRSTRREADGEAARTEGPSRPDRWRTDGRLRLSTPCRQRGCLRCSRRRGLAYDVPGERQGTLHRQTRFGAYAPLLAGEARSFGELHGSADAARPEHRVHGSCLCRPAALRASGSRMNIQEEVKL